MPQINTINELFKHFNFNNDIKLQISQLYQTHKESFLKPLIGICVGIKRQAKEVLKNEYEHPKGFFYVKTNNIKVVYKKESLEIVNITWIG